MVHRRVQKHDKRTLSNSQEIQDKPLIRKSKQIQTTNGKNQTYQKTKRSSWRTFTLKIILIQIQKNLGLYKENK